MAPSFTAIADVSDCRETLNVMVRVVRLWTVPSFNNGSVAGSIEMVFMDKNGDKMHCTVRRHLVSRFHNILEEVRCYKICSLAKMPNLGSYRTTKHDCKVIFHFQTTVSPIELPEVDLYGLSPTPFRDVLSDSLNTDYLIDVIGLMTGLTQPKEYERDGKVSRMSVLELTSENLKLECALFGEYVDQIQSYVGSGDGDVDLPVVVLQSVKVKNFRGKIGLQNVMFATKILFNPEAQEVLDFKNSISIEGSSNGVGFNIYRGDPHVSVDEDFMRLTPRGTIEKLTENKEGGSFIIMGTINSVIEEGPWWYASCRCGRSVLTEMGMYYCDICMRYIFSVFPRFKLKVEVEDSTGTAVFVLFERECSLLFQKTCAELFLEHMKSPEAIFSPTFSPMLSMGELESVGVGGGGIINLGDDSAIGDVHVLHDKKIGPRVCSSDMATNSFNGGQCGVVSVTPAKRKLEEEFNEVACCSSADEDINRQKVVSD